MGTTSRDLKPYTLQKLISDKDKYNAPLPDWNTLGTIQVAVYKTRKSVIVNNQREVMTFYKGLTRYSKGKIDGFDYRLVRIQDDKIIEIYKINDCIPSLWNVLDLEKVEIE